MVQNKCYNIICNVSKENKPELLTNKLFCEWANHIGLIVDKMFEDHEIDTTKCNIQSNCLEITLECNFNILFEDGISHPFFDIINKFDKFSFSCRKSGRLSIDLIKFIER